MADSQARNQPPAQDAGAHTRWNFAIIVIEASAFLIGLACVDPVAVLPLFVHALAPSTLIIGLVTTLQRLAYALPLLPMAAILGHRPRRLPFLRWGVFFGRLPFILFVIYLWAQGVDNARLTLAFMILGFVAVSGGNGVVAVPWQDIIAKSIPSRLRGRFFGVMGLCAALGTLGVGLGVRWALGPRGPEFPQNYTLLFAFAAIFFTVSTIGCAVVREPLRPALEHPESMRSLASAALGLLRGRREFRLLVVVAVLGFGLAFTMPFYIVYATTRLGVPEQMAGIYISAAVLSGAPLSVLWGYLNDRRGPRAVLRGSCLLVAATPVLALAIPALTGLAAPTLPGLRRVLPYTFALVFLAGGSTRGAMWMGTNNYLFELASDQERHRYIALLNTLAAPRTLFPVLTGWVLTLLSYETVFALLALLAFTLAAVSWRLPVPSLPEESSSLDRQNAAHVESECADAETRR